MTTGRPGNVELGCLNHGYPKSTTKFQIVLRADGRR